MTSKEPQVPTEVYTTFLHYNNLERWISYFYQIKEVLSQDITSMLEIGVGNGVLRDMIRSQSDITYQSLDIDPELKPDIEGSVTNIPLPDNAVDIICAFEILEHIPFEDFEPALQEIARVSKKGALISLPHFGPPIKFLFKIPLLPELFVHWKIPFPKKHVFNGHHYWEIGKKGYSPKKMRAIFEKYFIVQDEYVPFENQYHHFYVLRNKD